MGCGITANLCLTATQFALTTMKPPIKKLGVWNLSEVYAYGAVDGGFGFECYQKGRKTFFRLETSDGTAIQNAFDVQTGADTEFTRSRFAPGKLIKTVFLIKSISVHDRILNIWKINDPYTSS